MELVSLRSGVVGSYTFDEKGVALAAIWLEDKVLKLGNIIEALRLCLSLVPFACFSFVYKSHSHILEEVLIVRNIYS